MPNLKVISCLVKLQTRDSVMNWKCSLGCRCDVQDFPNRYHQRCKTLRISRTSIFTQTTNLITPYLTDRFSIHEQKQKKNLNPPWSKWQGKKKTILILQTYEPNAKTLWIVFICCESNLMSYWARTFIKRAIVHLNHFLCALKSNPMKYAMQTRFFLSPSVECNI